MVTLFQNEVAIDLLLATGYRKALCSLCLEDRDSIQSALLDYHCMLKVKAEMDQFSEGLADVGVLKYVKKYPDLMKSLFICDESKLITAGEFV